MEKHKCNICSKLFTDIDLMQKHKNAQHPKMKDRADLLGMAEERLYEFLSSDGTDRSLREIANKAVAVYSSEAKREASRNNALTAALMMARSVTSDKAEVRRIVRAALPGHPMIDAL